MDKYNPLEAIVNLDFYETLDEYTPALSDFHAVTVALLPRDWSFRRTNAVWFGCFPPGPSRLPQQGWKIHVSASLTDAEAVLHAVVPILAERAISFKFCVDRQMLAMMNSKQWSRGGSGKFITIYPSDEDEFKTLIEALYQVTRPYVGPYILSDKRYKDSKVLYYRYGGILPASVLNIKGEQRPVLVSPKGEYVPDIRYPYFVVPSWTRDPFTLDESDGTSSPSGVVLKEGRYRVQSVLRYSNAGGVYVAFDEVLGQEVVIKEARPGIETTIDSQSLLKKEFRLLTQIADIHISPQPIDYFSDWEHDFMVSEFIRGQSVSAFAARNNITLFSEPTEEQVLAYYEKFKTLMIQLARHISNLHQRGIVFADLSPENLIISTDGTLRLWILDFEGAHEVGHDLPIPLFTAGFAYRDQMYGAASTFASDYFAIGAIMHYILAPVNELFVINPKARYTFIAQVIRDIGFPAALTELITKLLSKDPQERPSPERIIEVLETSAPSGQPQFGFKTSIGYPRFQEEVIEISRHILQATTWNRRDRLFPAAGAIFRTNPFSVAHGAAGVAYFLHTVQGSVDPRIVEWVMSGLREGRGTPPGLYMGSAGIAWVLAHIGFIEEGVDVFRHTITHSQIKDSHDVYYGAAGCGLAALKMFSLTRNEEYVDWAISIARNLIHTRTLDVDACYWGSGNIAIGFAHGASGVATFFLYLYLVTKNAEYFDIGRQALEFDLRQSRPTLDGKGISWIKDTATPQIGFPYWGWGSAGVGAALLRYHRLTDDSRYRKLLEQIFIDTDRKYAVFPNHDRGLAGLGEFNLDLYQFSGSGRHLDGAYRVASGISLFKIQSADGLAFPGMPLTRASCDFATGSAGIGHFLHRLDHPTVESPFMLDYLFEGLDAAHATKDC